MSVIDNKVPPPIVMLSCGVLMWLFRDSFGEAAFGDWRIWLGFVIIVAGFTCAIAGRQAFAKAKTTINPVNISAASALVTGDVFQFTRNPMYLGMATMLLGVAVLLGHLWLVLGPIAFGLYIQQFQIKPEERVMLEKFGADYQDYRRRVRRWI